jgi:hypothetical protein
MPRAISLSTCASQKPHVVGIGHIRDALRGKDVLPGLCLHEAGSIDLPTDQVCPTQGFGKRNEPHRETLRPILLQRHIRHRPYDLNIS